MQRYVNVLVAEENEDDFLFIVDALHSIYPGFNVTRAKDGLECLRLLKEIEKPHLLFIDLELPSINALECLKYIKNHSKLFDLPVVITSPSCYIKHIDVAFREGALYYLVKPPRFSAIKAILEVFFEKLLLTEEVSKQNFVLKESNILKEQYV